MRVAPFCAPHQRPACPHHQAEQFLNTKFSSPAKLPLIVMPKWFALLPIAMLALCCCTTFHASNLNAAEPEAAATSEPSTGDNNGTIEGLQEVNDALRAVTDTEIAEAFARAERFYQGGRFGEARAIYMALMNNPNFRPLVPYHTLNADQRNLIPQEEYQQKRIDRQNDRERAMYGQARCRAMRAKQSGDRAEMTETIQDYQKLSQNIPRYEDPQYTRQALYGIAEVQVMLGEKDQAIETLSQILDQNPAGKLDWDTSRFLSELLVEKAMSLEAESASQEESISTQKNQLFEQAAIHLGRITENYPDMPDRQQAELQLIELRMAMGHYRDAYHLIETFRERQRENSPFNARAEMFRAQCLYFFGDIDKAAETLEKILEEEKTDPKTQIELWYSLGWCTARLAGIVGVEKRQHYLNRSKTAFRRALQQMAMNNPRRKPAIRQLGQVLLELEDYAGALAQFKQILRDPRLHVQASFYAGMASKGMQQWDEAQTYFENALRGAEEREQQQFSLQAMQELAGLQMRQGHWGEAFLYAKQSVDEAAKILDYTTLAEAQLQQVRALSGLGQKQPQEQYRCGQQTLDAFATLLLCGRKPEPRTIGASIGAFDFQLQALSAYEHASVKNYDDALNRIAVLRKRLGSRLRKDHLDFEEARTLFFRADAMRAQATIEPKSAEETYKAIAAEYKKSASAARQAAQANPHGALSADINLFLGDIGFTHGKFAYEVAQILTDSGQSDAAAQLKEDAKQTLEATLPAYEFVIFSDEATVEERINARTRQGETYFQLEEYDKSLLSFRTLADDTSLDRAQRIHATIRWAKALAILGKSEQAIQKLQPYIAFDIDAALLAATLYEKLGFFHHARDTYLTGLTLESPDSARLARAECAYRAYRLGLVKPVEVAQNSDPDIMFETSAEALSQFARDYADTHFASLALMDLGNSLLKKGEWKAALKIADSRIPEIHNHVETLQALYILKGRALLKGGQAKEALAAFGMAERMNTDTPDGRRQRAVAIREQGNAWAALKNYDQALLYYGRVFAIFNREEEESDTARIAAAEIYARQGDMERARSVLNNGHDKPLMRSTSAQLDKKYGN